MTITELNNYRKRQQEISDIQEELNLNHYVTDNIKVCTPPSYTQHSKHIEGYLPDGNTLTLLTRLSALRERQRGCEEYIGSIEDYQTRKMFVLKFLKGKTYLQVAMEISNGRMSESGIRMRIQRYLQDN